MTNIAWLHNDIAGGSAFLPGKHAGGGEMADDGMIARAPDDATVVRIPAPSWEEALEFDLIVVAATDQLSDAALQALAGRQPWVWVHHKQAETPARKELFTHAERFICMSKFHADLEQRWVNRAPEWNHGWIDPLDVSPADKTHDALWAARNHPQKGLINARLWATRENRALTEITNAPRDLVLEAMSKHRTFVFLPKGIDSCPRTLIEAELAGCDIVTNSNAGRRDPGILEDVLYEQPAKFWQHR
ncbi:hypothetical protein OAV85_04055 [Candidatus Nanopelagicales bacterium]|nr:hypothetical protein [Candidatus Nanopelagicales bacterium]